MEILIPFLNGFNEHFNFGISWNCLIFYGFLDYFLVKFHSKFSSKFPPLKNPPAILIPVIQSIKKLITIFSPQNQLQFRIFPFKSGRSNNVINYFPSDKMETISKFKFCFSSRLNIFTWIFFFLKEIFRSFRKWKIFNWMMERFPGNFELQMFWKLEIW
jgi:hypothetical protein